MREGGDFGPAEVSELLGVSPSTLRTYSVKFDPLLSSRARGGMRDGGSGYAHRRYDARDVELLGRAKELLDEGLSYDSTLRQLDSGGVLARPVLAGTRPRSRGIGPSSPAPGRRGSPRTESSGGAADQIRVRTRPIVAGDAILPERSGTSPGAERRDEFQTPLPPIGQEADPPPLPNEDDDPVAGSVLAERAALMEDLRQVIEEAVAPLRAEVGILAERVRVAEERASAGERSFAEAQARLTSLQRHLDAIVSQLSDAPVPSSSERTTDRGWLSHLLRRG